MNAETSPTEIPQGNDETVLLEQQFDKNDVTLSNLKDMVRIGQRMGPKSPPLGDVAQWSPVMECAPVNKCSCPFNRQSLDFLDGYDGARTPVP